jgi:isopenicillin-N N-acyltransferase like protein
MSLGGIPGQVLELSSKAMILKETSDTMTRYLRILLCLCLLLGAQTLGPPEAVASSTQKPRITSVGNVRIMHLVGTPFEMGRQHGRLLKAEVQRLYNDYIVAFAGGQTQVAIGTKVAQFSMLPNIPKAYVEEMRGLAAGSGLSFEQVLVAQAFLDIKKIVQCSTVALTGKASEFSEPMLGRNLDFPSLGFIHRHSIVVVRHPTQGQVTVSVGWPLLLGTFSGMNASGVSLAMMEVYTKTSSLNGMPYALLFRQALESSKTTSDVVRFIEKAQHTASNNLMVLDGKGHAALVEITADVVAVRRPADGKLYATNHHRSAPLAQKTSCWRYRLLEKRLSAPDTRLGLKNLTALLDDVDQKELNLQAMVFLPRKRSLHLSAGKIPAAKGPYIELSREALFGPTEKETR